MATNWLPFLYGESMNRKRFVSVWDAISDTPEEAEQMKTEAKQRKTPAQAIKELAEAMESLEGFDKVRKAQDAAAQALSIDAASRDALDCEIDRVRRKQEKS